MRADFDFNLYIIEQLVQKLINSSGRSSRLSLMTVRERVIYSAWSHLNIGDLDKLTKDVLVNETLAPRRSINRAIERLAEEGMLAYMDGKIRVVSEDKLEETASVLLSS